MYDRLTLLCTAPLLLAALAAGEAPRIDPAGLDGEVVLAGPDAEEKLRQRADESRGAIPGVLVHYRKAGDKPGLPKALKPSDAKVVVELDADAAVSVKGRTIRALAGEVRLHLAATKAKRAQAITLKAKGVEDLTRLRRAARDRADAFPPAKVGVPHVAKGALVIVGGGGLPKGLIERFVELAGGDKAKIVILPTAMPDPLPKGEGLAAAFKKAGAAKVTTLKGRTREAVEGKESLAALGEATGIWFGGGRQWRFIDAYEGTKAVPLMFDVLKRGGVIGGSSAGATIQGEYLCRGGVFTNFDIAYEGYERGLSFLPGVAIDQHFAQRKRFKDMSDLMKLYPAYLGIGIDEATALVVTGSVAEVTGRGQAHFYDAKRRPEEGKPDYESVAEGGRYDLKARKVLPADASPTR